MEILGERIRKLRTENNYTLRELGNKLNMSFSILAMYERNERTPPVDKLLLLADFFSVCTDYLLGKTNIRKYPEKELDKFNYSGDSLIKIPVVERINTDEPVVSEDNIITYRIMPQKQSTENSNDKSYLYFKVETDSMTGSRIYPGDLLLIRKQKRVKNGSIAAILINNEKSIIRKIYRKNEQYILQPDNPKYESITINGDNVTIIGKVIRVEFDL